MPTEVLHRPAYTPPAYKPQGQATQGQGQRQYAQTRRQAPAQSGGSPAQQIVRRPTQSGEPLEGINLVILQGYFAHFSLIYTQTGTARAKFDIIVPMPIYERGEVVVEPNGQIKTRDTTERCEAWGEIAQSLESVPEGTPIKIQGSNNKFSIIQPDNSKVWIKDVKVSYWEFV